MTVQKQTRAGQRTRLKAFAAIGDFNGQCSKSSKEVPVLPKWKAPHRALQVPKKLLHMAGIEVCYTSARVSTATLGNFAETTYLAIQQTYSYLTPDLLRGRELINH
ncbi:putative 40S ribosomal protein [Ixodes scapularis]